MYGLMCFLSFVLSQLDEAELPLFLYDLYFLLATRMARINSYQPRPDDLDFFDFSLRDLLQFHNRIPTPTSRYRRAYQRPQAQDDEDVENIEMTSDGSLNETGKVCTRPSRPSSPFENYGQSSMFTKKDLFEPTVRYCLQGDATIIRVQQRKLCLTSNLLRTKLRDGKYLNTKASSAGYTAATSSSQSETLVVLKCHEDPLLLQPSLYEMIANSFHHLPKGTWPATETNRLPFDVRYKDAFATYVTWLQTGHFDIFHTTDDFCTEKWHPACFSVDLLAEACFIGQELEDMAYRNAVADELIRICVKYGVYPNLEVVRRCWPNLPTRCGMRLATTELLGRHVSEADLNANIKALPQELKDEMLKMVIRERDNPHLFQLPGDKDPSYYHESEDSGDDWEQ